MILEFFSLFLWFLRQGCGFCDSVSGAWHDLITGERG